MSKSKGNVIYADDMVDLFGVDATRYFVLHEMPFENDGIITWDLVIERFNSELANVLGNLVNRTVSMTNKYFDGIVKSTGDTADQADIDATLDFMYWCVSSDEGTKAMANDMGFVIPFKNAQESPNLFVKVDNALTAEGKTPVAWCFSTMPSENWKNGVGSALTAYAAGTGDWNAVVTAFVEGWKTEAALNAG